MSDTPIDTRRILKSSDVPINRHRQVSALFEGIGIGKNRHRQFFEESVSASASAKLCRFFLFNLTIINCLSWLKSAGVNPGESVVPPIPERISGTPKMGGGK